MSFDEEWAQAKADVARRPDEARMQLAQLDGGTGPTPSPSPSPSAPNLALDDAPVRTKASGTKTANGEGRKKTKLDDAEAAGKAHPSWESGKESNTCVSSWQRRLHQLSDLIEEAADALTKGMDMQISEDGSVAREMTAAADWLERA